MKRSTLSQQNGYALTLTLILIVLAAIIAVSFLTTTTTERSTAAAYGRVEKADQLARAGVDAAITRIVTEMTYRPYHAIGYRSVSVGSGLTEIIPVITGPRSTNPATPTYNTAPVANEDVYLVSTTGSSAAAGVPGSAAPASLDNTNSVDLNSNHLATEPNGWIGSPVASATPIPYRAPWIDVLRDPTQPAQPDPNGKNYNPVVGRYAYWVEDETAKVDASVVGNKNGGGAFQRGDGIDVTDLDVGALPLVNASPLPAADTSTNTAIINFRNALPMLDARFLNRIGGGLAPDVHETTKFYETAFSLSNDLAGTGRRRANLNRLVTNTSDAATIAANIDDIGYVITGTHLVDSGLSPTPKSGTRVFESGPVTQNALTDFGSRFFTSSTPSADQKKMYVERIAANIRDYIDTDSLATYIDTGDNVISDVKPALAWNSGTEPRAVGKEAVPILQEIAWYGYQRKMQDEGASVPRTRSYDVDIDFYAEFFNPSTKDFVTPPGAFLKVYDRVTWRAGSYPPLKPPDSEYPIPGITFPAGSVTVLTTESDPSLDPPGLIPDGKKLIRITGGTRNFTGKTDEKISNTVGLQMDGRASASGVTDYKTEMVWGTPTGIYEAMGYVASGGDGNKTWNMDGNAAEMQNKKRFVYAYSLRGNDQPSRTGDARSLSEQLSMTGGLASLGNDQTRFYANVLGTGILPGDTTFGKAGNPKFVNTTKWPDYTPALADNNITAYAIQRDAPMQSVGELGNIYDPVRTIASNDGALKPSILRARGGGRTLRVGQSESADLTGARFTTKWFNAAWRLTDLFAADLTKDGSGEYVKVAKPTSRGRLNINGVLRDNGTAFKAALRNFTFKAAPESDQKLNGNGFKDPEADQLVADIKTYLTTNGPMMERGELSQLPFFNTGTGGGATFSTVNDRGREEIFRRCTEMITTRSASFTVYAIGQTVRQDKAGTKTSSGQKRLAITFQLQPSKAGTPLETNTIPSDVADGYAVKKVYAPN